METKTVVGMVLTLPLMALGGTFTWTGAENGAWTNANNWAEGIVPGQYSTAGGRVGQMGDVAVFGDALTGAKATTIDFDGVYSVAQIVTSGTNRYTYGTSDAQYVPIERNGVFSVAETPGTPAATLAARLRLGVECMVTNWGGDQVTVRNNSREPLVLGKWGYSTKAPATPGGGGEPGTKFEGTGDLVLNDVFERGTLGHYHMARFALTGKVTVNAKTELRLFEVSNVTGGTPLEIEIAENGTLEPISCYNYLAISRPVRVTGAGTWKFGVGLRSNAGVICESSIYSDLFLGCRVENKFIGGQPPADYPQRLYWRAGGASLQIAGPSTLQGLVLGNSANTGARLIVEHLGEKGTFGSWGDVDFLLGNNSTLRYVGAGETSNRDLILQNPSGTQGTGILEQSGTGDLVLDSAVTLGTGMTTGQLTLKGSTDAAATLAGTVDPAVKVVKQGTGTWTFAPANAWSNTLAMQDGGCLRIGSQVHVTTFTVQGGSNNRVIVEEGRSLDIDTLTVVSGKTVDFALAGVEASIKIRNGTPGAAIAGVTLNGHAAVVGEDLSLVPAPNSAAIWKAAVSGDWATDANWMWDLAPSAERDTFVDAVGGDYTVTLAADALTTNLFVKNVGAGTATLLVTNGATLHVKGHTTSKPLLTVGEGGLIDVVDATVRVTDEGNASGDISNVSSLKLDGGEIRVRGTGAFANYGISERINPAVTQNRNTQYDFGVGTVTFEDDARLLCEQETSKTVHYHNVRAAAGKTARVSFKGRSRPAFTFVPWNLQMYGMGGHAVLEFDSDWDQPVKNLWNQTFIGMGGGLSEILFKKGSYEFGTWDMFHIASPGSDSSSGTSALFTTGRVEIAANASLKIYGQNPLSTTYGGFTVGHGVAMKVARGNSYLRGEFLVAGQYTQVKGNFIVGEGPCADGEVRQIGGSVKAMADEVPEGNTLGDVVLGLHGGKGRYLLEDGTFETTRIVYVGGATMDDMRHVHANAANLQQWHDAEGELNVLGGSFKTVRDIVLGRDGTGWLVLSGTGRVEAAAVTVESTAGQPASGLHFVADEQGRCGTLAAGEVSLAFGAKIKVDVSACAESRTRVPVWNLDAAPAGLADAEIELVGAESVKEANGLKLADGGKSLFWCKMNGTVLMIR